MKLSDYVMDAIAAAGVRHVFMLPGGGSMHLVDSLGRNPDLDYVCNLHEQGCAIAADAYGQYTNNLGVAMVTTGPGGTNALTGVAAAWLDSTPTLFLSGQVKRADLSTGTGVRQTGFQEVDLVSMVRPITKFATLVEDPGQIRRAMEEAISTATSGRPGPVWVDIPLDVQAADIDPEGLIGYEPAPYEVPAELERDVAASLATLEQAERPIILVGNGVRLADAVKPFRQLVDLLGIPVLTTWKAADFLPESHPLYVGRPGSIGQRAANFAQQTSDAILILGARLDAGQTGYNHENFARHARKVMVDVDPCELAKMRFDIDVEIECDAGEVIAEFLRQLGETPCEQRSGWLEQCAYWRKAYPVVLPEFHERTGAVDLYVLIDRLAKSTNADDIIVPGSSGACSEVVMQAFQVTEGQRILNSQGLGAMGFGIAAAIGACLASGGRRTITVDGDGGFHMNTQELETVRRLDLPIKFFVLNNQGYGSIRATQRNHFDSRFVASDDSSGLTLPGTARLAEAFGITSWIVDDHDQLEKAIDEAFGHPGPALVEVILDRDQATSPRLTSRQLPDGTMVSSPLEDLWPFLDRDELERNMAVGSTPDADRAD